MESASNNIDSTKNFDNCPNSGPNSSPNSSPITEEEVTPSKLMEELVSDVSQIKPSKDFVE